MLAKQIILTIEFNCNKVMLVGGITEVEDSEVEDGSVVEDEDAIGAEAIVKKNDET